MTKTAIEKLAKEIISTVAEKEVERFLMEFLQGTEFANKAYAVGGYVRDQVLGLEAKDLDIVVSMKDGAEKLTHYIREQLGQSISTPRQMGASYPIWQITFKEDITFNGETYKTAGAIIEFADTMKETFPDETTRQRQTEYGTLEEDVERRDFTVNMLLKDLSSGEVKDLTGTSREDLEKGILRGHPRVSLDVIFSNDPLRMIRLLRFQAKYGWKIPLSVLKTVKRNAERIEIVSSERIMGELEKVMAVGKLYQAIKLMKITGLLKYVLPEIEALKGVTQGKDHHSEGDVFKHTLLVLKNAPKTVEGQLAALLHDVGKARTQEVLEDTVHFYTHEDVSAEMAEAILYRLKFDKKTIERVVKLVREHMRPHTLEGASPKAFRKLIRDMGEELTDVLLDLAEADSLGSYPIENIVPNLREEIERIRKAPVKMEKKPILGGQEIMDTLHIKPGPKVGEVSKFLIELADDYAEQGKKLSKEEAKEIIIKNYVA